MVDSAGHIIHIGKLKRNSNIMVDSAGHIIHIGKCCLVMDLSILANYVMSGGHMSRDMRFLKMWSVRPAKTQTSLRICTVWSEP